MFLKIACIYLRDYNPEQHCNFKRRKNLTSYILYTNHSKYQKGDYYTGIKLFSKLRPTIKRPSIRLSKFMNQIIRYNILEIKFHVVLND